MIQEQVFEPGRFLVFSSGDEITIQANSSARLLLFGGEPLDGLRHLWWNFVRARASGSSRRRAIGKQALRAGPGDAEFIPLPEGS